MAVNDLAPLAPEPQALVRAAALTWAQPGRIEEFAARHDVEVTEVAALLADPSRTMQIQGELARLRRSGELIKERAFPAMEKFAARVEGMLDDPDLTPNALSKLAETLFKLSGLAEERSAALRREAAQTTGQPLIFTIIAPDGTRLETPLNGRVIEADEVDGD